MNPPRRPSPPLATCALILALAVAAAPARAAATYDLTILGILNGGTYSTANAINSHGQIAGTADDQNGSPRGVLYDGGTMTELIPLSGDRSPAWGINDDGHVVGQFGSVNAAHAYLYDGTMHDLGVLGTDPQVSGANGINSAGHVVGWSSLQGVSGIGHAFLYDGSTMHDLGSLGGTSGSQARAINDSDQIVGDTETSDGESHAFLYENGTMHDLGTLAGGDYSSAAAINASGRIVGYSFIGSAAMHAFLYDGTMHDLATLGGANSQAFGINASGQIVGYSDTASGGTHAFLYEGGTMIDLNTLLSDQNSGWTLAMATAINDSGWIVGTAFDAQGQQRGFLLTPNAPAVPEPSAMVLMTLGAAGAASLATRRRGRVAPR